MISRRPDGYIPGLGGAPDLLDAAFALESDGATSKKIFEVGSRLVLIQRLERTGPGETELAEAALTQGETLLNVKRNRRITDWIDQRRSELEASGQMVINSSVVISGI